MVPWPSPTLWSWTVWGDRECFTSCRDDGENPQPGSLTTTLQIPVLSWLYQLLFNQPLTLLNALTLIISIPVTIIWRIIEGQWPAERPPDQRSPDHRTGRRAHIWRPRRGHASGSAQMQQLLANVNLIVSIVGGIVSGVGDAFGAGDEPVILGQGAPCSHRRRGLPPRIFSATH